MAKKKTALKPSETLNVLLDEVSGPTVGDLAAELISAMGGTRSFALEYVKELRSSAVKGVAKAKMLEGIMRIVTASSAQNKGNERDESAMSDDELREEAMRLLGGDKVDAPA